MIYPSKCIPWSTVGTGLRGAGPAWCRDWLAEHPEATVRVTREPRGQLSLRIPQGRDHLAQSGVEARRLHLWLWHCGRFHSPSYHVAGSLRTRSYKRGLPLSKESDKMSVGGIT